MWTLVLYIYAGIWSKTDSVTMTTVTGFKTEQVCIEAGKKSAPLVADSKKEIRYVCLKVE